MATDVTLLGRVLDGVVSTKVADLPFVLIKEEPLLPRMGSIEAGAGLSNCIRSFWLWWYVPDVSLLLKVGLGVVTTVGRGPDPPYV